MRCGLFNVITLTQTVGIVRNWNQCAILVAQMYNRHFVISGLYTEGQDPLTTACAVLAPAALVGAVTAVGFGAGGIVAGTPAAAWMATSGGATAAGGLTAMAQSIGAAGLAAPGTAITGFFGGLFGAGAAAAAEQAYTKVTKNQRRKEISSKKWV
ncbi:hypothetical protein HDU89_003713 [Geranomyces variabilis]|nr:hypothetical protein HDU89_003713 [Geranomyces variabilis]